MPNRTTPELLAPAGNMEKVETALLYGADAVYLGGPGLNLRGGSACLDWEETGRAVSLARASGARVYFCLNAFPRQDQLALAGDHLERLADLSVDGLIIADPGVFRLARRRLPSVPVHVSTQANTSNAESVAFWRDLGASRVNLARELSLRDIREIARAGTGMELEVFVHGAMCLALSGRCLLSAHLNGRSANLGLCTHPCRYEYRTVGLALEEATRPGEALWEVYEEEGHSAFFSPDDLCLVKFLGWLAKAGVAALKIEGRMKSGGYLAQVVDVYRTALDDLAAGRFRQGLYLDELRNAASRDLTTGFFLPRRRGYGGREGRKRSVLARVLQAGGEGRWRVAVRAPWDASSDAALLLPGLRRPVLKAGEYAIENDLGEALTRVNSGLDAWLRTDSPDVAAGLYLRGL